MGYYNKNITDKELIDAASALISQRAELGKHHIAAALLSSSGLIYTGLHLTANVGRNSICAEAAALAEALKYSPIKIIKIVSVRYNFEMHTQIEIVPPCGNCRELILYNSPDAEVILQSGERIINAPIQELLRYPFKSRNNSVE